MHETRLLQRRAALKHCAQRAAPHHCRGKRTDSGGPRHRKRFTPSSLLRPRRCLASACETSSAAGISATRKNTELSLARSVNARQRGKQLKPAGCWLNSARLCPRESIQQSSQRFGTAGPRREGSRSAHLACWAAGRLRATQWSTTAVARSRASCAAAGSAWIPALPLCTASCWRTLR